MLLEIKQSKRLRKGNPPRVMLLQCDVCEKQYERKYNKSDAKREVHRCSKALRRKQHRRVHHSHTS